MIKISSIVPNPENPRIIRDERFKALVKSIQDFPAMMPLRPIIVDANRVVLGGLAINYTSGITFNVQPLALNKLDLLSWIIRFSDHFNEIITWNKGQATPAMARSVCSSTYEWIVVFSKNNKSRSIPLSSWKGTVSNVYNGPPQRNNEYASSHAATFPLHLPSWVISELMNKCSGVIDPFIGTGSTMVAAHKLGRKSSGIELDPKYCQIIVDRMRKLDPSLIVKKNGIICTEKAQNG